MIRSNSSNNATYRAVVQRFIDDPENRDNGKLISEIYHFMSKSYRNEYFYQNTLLNKLLLGRHSLNTTIALTQIPISKSKADFILINGKAIVYEIKTELDTFERLETQLRDYYKAFDHVCVVTSEGQYDKLNTHRSRILHFNTELLRGDKHTREDFIEALAEIDFYERYCREHPDYENNRAVLAIENIERVYKELMENGGFL